MSDDKKSLTRRSFLSAAAAGIAASFAGCVRQSNEPLTPEFDQMLLNEQGWSKLESINVTETRFLSLGGQKREVQIKAKGQTFETGELAERVEETFPRTTVNSNLFFPVVVFGGMKVRTDPPARALSQTAPNPRRIVLNSIEKPFMDRVEAFGIENFEQVDETTMRVETGEEAVFRTYHTKFPYSSARVDVGNRTATIESGEFKLEARAAVWFHNGLIASTMGLYPRETGDIKVTVDGQTGTENLGFTPEQYRSDIEKLMKRMD